MKRRMVLFACSLMLATSCAGGSQNNMSTAQNAMPANDVGATASAPAAPAAPAASSGAADVRQLAECAATMDALGRLYDAIASGEQGARRDELSRTAVARRSAAFGFEMEASGAAMRSGGAQADVERIKRDRNAQLEQERARQADFGEFAVWLGREGDRCAAAYPSIH